MKALDFESMSMPGGQIALPPEVAEQIPAGERVRAWQWAGRQKFESAYAPEDAVYEQLIDDTAIR